MRKLAVVLFGLVCSVSSAEALLFDNGELCINSMQCSSKMCLHDTNGNLTYCMSKGVEGSRCAKQTIYGIYYYPTCERGLTCAVLNDGDEYGVCLDDTTVVSIAISNGQIKTEYIDYDGTTKYVYRCDSGYYGANPSVSGGCKPCPASGVCLSGNNDDFYCWAGYYRNGDQCLRCPSVQDVSGNTIYGSTPDILSRDGVNRCTLDAGTYVDNTGTFELSDTCVATL